MNFLESGSFDVKQQVVDKGKVNRVKERAGGVSHPNMDEGSVTVHWLTWGLVLAVVFRFVVS